MNDKSQGYDVGTWEVQNQDGSGPRGFLICQAGMNEERQECIKE
jgi:hypothetical protein